MSNEFSVGDTVWLAHTHVEHDGLTRASVVEVRIIAIEGDSAVCRWPSGGLWSENLNRVHATEEAAYGAIGERLHAAIARVKAAAAEMAAKAAACRVGEAVPS
jgi:hypothetical protein